MASLDVMLNLFRLNQHVALLAALRMPGWKSRYFDTVVVSMTLIANPMELLTKTHYCQYIKLQTKLMEATVLWYCSSQYG